MRRIEFLGVPGSGKSTLAAQLVPALPDAYDLEDATRRALRDHGQDDITRLAARLTASGSSQSWQRAYVRSTDRFAALVRFMSVNPKLVQVVLRAQRKRADRDLEPERALAWLLNLMAGYQLAVESPNGTGTLIIDEGFAQRSVALFGFGFTVGDEASLRRYVEAAPVADLVVLMETPLVVCVDRLDKTGWSSRLEELTSTARLEALHSSGQVVNLVVGHLVRQGVDVLSVSGTGSMVDSIAAVKARLEGRR